VPRRLRKPSGTGTGFKTDAVVLRLTPFVPEVTRQFIKMYA
jgi:hypothetical protein